MGGDFQGTIKDTGRKDAVGRPIYEVEAGAGPLAVAAVAGMAAGAAVTYLGLKAAESGLIKAATTSAQRGVQTYAGVPVSASANQQGRGAKTSTSLAVNVSALVFIGAVALCLLLMLLAVGLDIVPATTIALFTAGTAGLFGFLAFLMPVVVRRYESPGLRVAREANMADWLRASRLRAAVPALCAIANSPTAPERATLLQSAALSSVHLNGASSYMVVVVPSQEGMQDVVRVDIPPSGAGAASIADNLVAMGAALGPGSHTDAAIREVAPVLAAAFSGDDHWARDTLEAMAGMDVTIRPTLNIAGLRLAAHEVAAADITISGQDLMRVFPLQLIFSVADTVGIHLQEPLVGRAAPSTWTEVPPPNG